ncbi:hypothetical protein HDG37_002994 [Paraburkholderia sp. MM5384-R2]|nr:hypothetical protein [Paraburkholderia sp. MM5384-R2]
MLVVDEIHHLLAGSYREQRASLNLLKFHANDLQISMVLVGTRDAVLALQTDAQMISRYTPFRSPAGAKATVYGGCSPHLNGCCRCASRRISRDARSFSLS